MAKARFDWNPAKDAENQGKHGVSFARAQYAFADPRRVIAKGDAHSQTEERFYCFGEVTAVCSRCASLTAHRLFESSAPAIGAKERHSMSGKIKYTDEPLGDVQVVADLLPSPAELAFREEGVKVTLALS
ncbi:MAG: BrnT family toxin [Rhodocyclaceae bacterium]|nr:BrnT family toxin [Rhodocyclaceae bacterium]